ncbi:MAG: alanine dehydrogenase [Lutibacter sp.]|uniref:NAD(P)-dependent oxidoreductase n=1 Tax=Lutibacter sp. TaxID=1925666 RepID=UPI00183DDCD1|nr:NAD(P)-dependent oxidoreductase [Lutibacter sp.]MBT8318152.1 NAD(P)-dependent oxidoreductase [Lutibacter sp.]NNJ59012.1 alanine dehydrogenase [Lutibacter sp.]
MKIGIIKERKNPPDRRVVLSPKKCKELLNEFPELTIKVESSEDRFFTDADYRIEGMEVVNDVSDCDVLLGVKEVPKTNLIPNKKYFFFSHTIKKQAYNRDLLQEILAKNIELYDHETITNKNNIRLVAFGRYAGIVGAYNGFRTYGLKYNRFNLPKAEELHDQLMLIHELQKLELPPIKVVLTGKGRVSNGAKEMLDGMGMREVSVEQFLSQIFDEAVYVQIDVLDYNKRKDGKVINEQDFFKNPQEYESNFMRFANVSDLYIACHFFGSGSPYIFTREDAKSENFKIKVVADISCDIDGPVASTIRPSTIANPIYGYHPLTEKEVDYLNSDAIAVMAVDNLPCELPKDASEGFGESFATYVIPAFFNNDKDGVLQRAKMTENGKLTERFSYLQDFVDGE